MGVVLSVTLLATAWLLRCACCAACATGSLSLRTSLQLDKALRRQDVQEQLTKLRVIGQRREVGAGLVLVLVFVLVLMLLEVLRVWHLCWYCCCRRSAGCMAAFCFCTVCMCVWFSV
jgi:hypothetical protein